jgi:hypothetical protein
MSAAEEEQTDKSINNEGLHEAALHLDHLMEWGTEASDIFADVARDAGDFSLHGATEASYDSLWNVALLLDGLRSDLPDDRLAESRDKLHALLPFDHQELDGLVARMKPFVHSGWPTVGEYWYNAAEAETKDVVLLDRWRRWVEKNINDDKPTDAVTVLEILNQINEILRDEAGPPFRG